MAIRLSDAISLLKRLISLALADFVRSSNISSSKSSRLPSISERWTTEVYNFPISAAIFRNITKSLNIDLPERAIRDGQELISILSKVTPSVRIISVQKRRELQVWPSDDRNGATIELTEISIPERVMTISIEHQDLEKVTKALEYLQLTSHSIRVLSYVDCLRVWVEDKSLF
jgi:hypothetical protein